MANRVSYLNFLSKNKHSLIGDVAQISEHPYYAPQTLDVNSHLNSSQHLLSQSSSAMNMKQQRGIDMGQIEHRAYLESIGTSARREDHLFEDKYIINEKTIGSK